MGIKFWNTIIPHADIAQQTISLEEITEYESFKSVRIRLMIDVKEKAIRHGLMELGWTPPNPSFIGQYPLICRQDHDGAIFLYYRNEKGELMRKEYCDGSWSVAEHA